MGYAPPQTWRIHDKDKQKLNLSLSPTTIPTSQKQSIEKNIWAKQPQLYHGQGEPKLIPEEVFRLSSSLWIWFEAVLLGDLGLPC